MLVLLCILCVNLCTLNHTFLLFSSQGSQTLIHKLHNKQLQVSTNFLACFVQSEHLNPVPKALTTLDFDGKLLPAREKYVGRDADRFRVAHPQHPVSNWNDSFGASAVFV